jgi:hypothetical protein
MLSLRCRAWLQSDEGNRWMPIRATPILTRCAETIEAACASVACNGQYDPALKWFRAPPDGGRSANGERLCRSIHTDLQWEDQRSCTA